jgi:predicted adenylyl cyclase CyaB
MNERGDTVRRNVEIKAILDDPEAVRERIEALADEGPIVIEQEDTFFHSPKGRLKIRKFGTGEGELIYYERPDRAEPVESKYVISRTTDPGGLERLLGRLFDLRGRIEKKRLLYLTGNTRIHLDEVEGLGSFVELEVVLAPDEPVEGAEKWAKELMTTLGIEADRLIEKAYIDILEEREKR